MLVTERVEVLQKKYKEYMQDFASKEKMTVEELITRYVGNDSSKEDMYNTDIILNFLADYYSYYQHEYESLKDDDILSEELRKKLDEIDEEYSIFEELIYGTAERLAAEKKEGTVPNLTPREIQDGIDGRVEDISFEDMRKVSSWIRKSYYDYLEKFRNIEMTLILPNKRRIVFSIKDGKLPHLLGIPNEGMKPFTRMQKISEILNPNLSEEEVALRVVEVRKNMSFDKIKYKNYIFQNYVLALGEPLLVLYDVRSKPNKKNKCDAFIVSGFKNKRYNKVSLGLAYDRKENKSVSCDAKSLLIEKELDDDAIYESAKSTISTALFINPKGNPNNEKLIGIFSVEEQKKLIESLLEEDEGRGRTLLNSLLPYFKRIYANIERVELSIEKIRELKKENSKSK